MSATTRGRPLVIGVVIAILVVVVVATVLVVRRPARTDLLIVGDSVSYMSAGKIIDRLGDRRDLHFIAIPGDTTQQALDRLDDAITEDAGNVNPDGEVGVLIGYNDLYQDTVETDALPQLVERSSRFRCGVWLTLPGAPEGMEANRDIAPAEVARWNERLATEIERYPNLHLANDWRAAVNQSSGEELLTDDALHPNENGEKVLARAYEAALSRAC